MFEGRVLKFKQYEKAQTSFEKVWVKFGVKLKRCIKYRTKRHKPDLEKCITSKMATF